jgi:hypothetical protein
MREMSQGGRDGQKKELSWNTVPLGNPVSKAVQSCSLLSKEPGYSTFTLVSHQMRMPLPVV